jgi:hypothetical protein
VAAFFQSNYPWSGGVNQQGAHVINQPVVITGQFQKQAGQRSFPPSVTSPGTVASAGTVANTTGYDCLVYASATTGISASKILTYNGANTGTVSPSGTIPGAAMGAFLVPGPGAIVLTYTGTLTWTWQAL